MGVTKKIIIPLNEIAAIKKCKTLGMMKAIKIDLKSEMAVAGVSNERNKKKSYKFTSFNDCNTTFKILDKLWRNVNPDAEGNGENTEEEDSSDLKSSVSSL
jgi:hypothetical protein